MSIKDLFSNKPTTMQSANSASAAIESPDFLEALRKQREEIVPPIDFLSASNFVRFGSAKEYYAESIKRIYNSYPYDGSNKEKIEFNLSSSYLDRYILDYKYPKQTGYAQFGFDSYIQINRGYKQATIPSSTKLSKLFQNNDPYHSTDKRKKQSFVFDLDDGVTIEWWMKKKAFGANQETFFELKSSNIKFDLVLTGTTEPIKMYASSSSEIALSTISDVGFESSNLANNTWSHYAVSISNTTGNTIVDFYRDGVRKRQTSFSKILTPTGNITGFLASGSYGLLSASVDEFRYWNKKQSSESIYSNYISGINGGANTDDYRKEISVYFKFNEGTTGDTSLDRIALDYSGRLSNGYWHEYSASNRQDGSYTTTEVADPIVRSAHPLVQSLLTEMQTSGSLYDANSKMQLYDLVPSWIRDEDEQNGEELKHIIQIIASYFDTLYAQIEFLPNIKDKHYYQDDEKPMPFVRRILEERGLLVSDILVNRSVVEYFQKKDLNGIQYEKDLEILKNRIYHNIYNNLEYIYKTKGTEKSYRNMLRCFGVDDELVKLNLYTDNGTQYLVDKTKHTSQKTKHIDFDEPDNFAATVFQQGTISGSTAQNLEKNNAITLEVELMIPKKPEETSVNYYTTSFLSSSVFGLDAVTPGFNKYVSTTNLNNFQVYLVRDKQESKRAKWVVEQTNHNAGTSTIVASSDFYEDIYDNQRWNVAVKVYPVGYPFAGSFSTTTNPNYVLEFYGVTHNFDEVIHEFTTTASLSYANGTSLLSAHKKVYVGARRTNWSGSILCQSDVKVAACSLYYDKLDAVSIKQHNLDPSNYGHNRVFGNPTPFINSATNTHLPAQHSLALHWDFQTVTGSDSSGQFTVEDFSSASVNGRYGWLGNIVVQEHKGTGFGFPVSNTGLVKNEFIFASKKELPEISFTSDNITIVGDDNVYLYEDEDVNDNVFAFEKSMYQIVSQEMLNLFTTMIEYSNMFAKPVDRYRYNYKRLAHARKLFFEKTSTDLDLDRFTEYYKWIDSSISFFLEQLHPSNAKFNKGITETVESHILERPKYQHILPNIEEQKTIKEQPARGINELTYNWKSGHAPAPGEAAYTNDNLNCLWRKEREERSGTNRIQREQLKVVISSDTYVEEVPSFGTNTGTTYQGSTYGLRRFSRPHRLSIKEQKTIHGGINYERAKDRDLLKAVIPRHGTKTSLGIPTDVVVLGVGPGQGLLDNQACEERNQNPTYKEKYGTIAILGKYSNFDGSSPISGSGITTVTQEYAYNLKGQRIFPFNMVSGNISTGYNAVISSSYFKDVYLTNLHSDTTDPTNEIPMQGPFTKTWVGGKQSRHIALNRGSDGEYTRPEEWRLLIGDHPDSADQDGALGLTGPDYGGPYPDPTRQSAVHYRDGRAKRPVNIQNVQTTGNIKGNYDEKYEVVSIVGRKENNLKFREFEPIHNFLPTQLGSALPATTNTLTLATIAPSASGNVWGIGESNRINSQPNLLRRGVLATGSFVVTGATLYKAAYTGSFDIQRIPHEGINQTYYFEVSGATKYYEVYTGSFAVATIPHAATHQTYHFETTGAAAYLNLGLPGDTYTGSFAFLSPPVAAQHGHVSFRVSASSGLNDGDGLSMTLDGTGRSVLVDTNGTMPSTPNIKIETYRRAIAGHGSNRGDLQMTDSSDWLGTGSFSMTFWINNISGSTNSTVNRFKFYKDTTSYTRHELRMYQETWEVRIEDVGGSPGDTAQFTVPIQSTSASVWNHVHVTFPIEQMASKSPRLWLNGKELSSTGYSPFTGVGDSIGKFVWSIDEEYAYQDLVFWRGVIEDQSAVDELYNGGTWKNPTTHTNASSILTYYPMGEENAHKHMDIGERFDTDGYGYEYFYPVFGTVAPTSADIFINTYYDEDLKIIKGKGNKTNDEIWNLLTASLEQSFGYYGTTYISGATEAQFFIKKDSAGSTTATVTRTGTSFDNIVSGSGATEVASQLANDDYIRFGNGSGIPYYFVYAHHTTSGSGVNTAQDFRKALQWKSYTNADFQFLGLYNTSYQSPSSSDNLISFSFWKAPDAVNVGSPDDPVMFVTNEIMFKPSIKCFRRDAHFHLELSSSNGKRAYKASNLFVGSTDWKHFTLVLDKTDITQKTLYQDGIEKNLNFESGGGTGALLNINSIYLGDTPNTTSNLNELQGALQDFCVWNTGLSGGDAHILYNSGSWFDIHSHPSASSIHDWWMLGNEAGMPNVGEELSTGSVSSIPPTVGQRALTVGYNTVIHVRDGISDNIRTGASFGAEIVSLIQANTNYSASVSSNTILLEQTSSSTISEVLLNSGDTFTISSNIGIDQRNISFLSGAAEGNTIQIEDEIFVVSTGSSPLTWSSSSANNIRVNATGSQFWNYLSGAIEQYLPAYSASYYVYDGLAQFFVRRTGSGDVADNTFSKSGTSFDNLHLALGSAASASSDLADGDTLILDGDTFTTRYTTSGSAATDFMVGTSYRKALNWIDSSQNFTHLKNITSYQNPDASSVSISFWANFVQVDGTQEYIAEFTDNSNTEAVTIRTSGGTGLNIRVKENGSGTNGYTYSNVLSANQWKHYTIVINKTLSNAVVLYVNGQVVSPSSTALGNNGALTSIEKVYIGDAGTIAATGNSLSGSLQDFVVWNTALDSQDAILLYNSGSWLDLHSHASASYIWDWWMLGNEPEITQASGSALDSNSLGPAVTLIPPTIGRHNLTVTDNSEIKVTDGIVQTKKTNSEFKTHIASVIRSQTAFSASVGSILLEVTSATDIHSTGSFEETGSTFTLGEGIVVAKYGDYYSGSYARHTIPGLIATQPEYGIKIQDKVFWVSGSTAPTQPYDTIGNNVFVYSHQSDDATWWNNLTSAIEQYLPEYTASYFVYNNNAQFFVRSGSEGKPANVVFQIGSNNPASGLANNLPTFTSSAETALQPFKNLHFTTGSVTSGSSTLADQDTLVITDNKGPKTFTVGHTTSGSAARYINTGEDYRKAFHFKDTTTSQLIHLKNELYTNPSSNNISISFWLNSGNTTTTDLKFILKSKDNSSADAIEIFTYQDELRVGFNGAGGSFDHLYDSTVRQNRWDNYTIIINTTDMQQLTVYRNGQAVSRTSTDGGGSGAIKDINKIYIGDSDTASVTEELQGSLQDFVIWNTGLDSKDATILYNSGSWLDIHSHPSASSIWDWWEFSGSASGSTIAVAGISSVAPAVGRHTLSLGSEAGGGVLVTDGVHDIGKKNLTFWREITQSVKDHTEFDQNFITATPATKFEVTASTIITGSMLLQGGAGNYTSSFEETGSTFGITPIHRGRDILTRQRYPNAGASHLQYIYFAPNGEPGATGSYFIIDNINNKGAGPEMLDAETTTGVVRESFNGIKTNYYKIRSSASTNQQFWNVLTASILATYPGYTIVTSSAGNTCKFELTGALETTSYLMDVTNIHNRVISAGKKKYSISSPSSSVSTGSYLYSNSAQAYSSSGGFSMSFWLKTEKSTMTGSYSTANDRIILDSYDTGSNRATYLKINSAKKATGSALSETWLQFGAHDNTAQRSEWGWRIHNNRLEDYKRGGFYTLTWGGDFGTDPELYRNAVLQTKGVNDYSASYGNGSGLSRKMIQKLYLLNSRPASGSNPLIGSLNDVALWETELDQNTITEIYNSGSNFNIDTTVSASALTDYWQLGQEGILTSSLVPHDPVPRLLIPAGSGFGNNVLTSSGELFYSVGFNDLTFTNPAAKKSTTHTEVSGVLGGVDQVFETGMINVVQRESDFITGSKRQKTIIASRFSAPGGVEVQTYGYLDAYAHEYSVHNSMNFRNLSTRGSGSGERGTIRVNSHSNRREGLNALYKRHSGKFGIDSSHGSVIVNDYQAEASFHKVPRNTYTKPIVKSKALKGPATTVGISGISGPTTGYTTTGAYSVSFWLKLDNDLVETRTIYSAKDPSGKVSHWLYLKANAFYWIFYNASDQVAYYYIPLSNFGLTMQDLVRDWNHIVFAWTGNTDSPSSETKNATATLYINSIAVEDHHPHHGGGAGTYSPHDIRRTISQIHLFDYWSGNSSYELQGAMQEFTTWQTNLDQNDVNQLFNNRKYVNYEKVAEDFPTVSTIIDHWPLGLGEEYDPYNYGDEIPTGFTVKATFGNFRNNLATNTTYIITQGFYNITDESKPTRKDNYFIQGPIPSSDYNYSWVTSSLGNNYNVRSGTQKVFGYWPKTGILSSSAGFDTAITFPTASNIQGS